jgi:LAO/AO transport system kinase
VRSRDPGELVGAVAAGDRSAIARLISLVERGGDAGREAGRLMFPLSGRAYTVGMTGPPGAGKSTLVDQLIRLLRAAGTEVGVLAVDPSSPFSGGAFLGDRVRMQEHALDRGVFIRSMATRGHLGGLAVATPEAIRVLDAAGLPVVLVETVGVGQVEVEIAGSADTTVVVLNPGAGDAVQAHKAGLFEVADVFAVNKADRPGVKELERDLHTMLDLDVGIHTGEAWRPPIVRTVAQTGEGVEELWAAVGKHRARLEETGELAERRRRRLAEELRRIVVGLLERRAERLAGGRDYDNALDDLQQRRVDPYTAGERIVQAMERTGGETRG